MNTPAPAAPPDLLRLSFTWMGEYTFPTPAKNLRKAFVSIVALVCSAPSSLLRVQAATPVPAASPAVVDSRAEQEEKLGLEKSDGVIDVVRNFVRRYEPTELGLTKDKSDELFMDFKFSLMFPLIGDWVDQVPTKDPCWEFGPFDSQHTALLFSATIRGGQYIWSRPSAPVIEKRFNPQFVLRSSFTGKRDLERYVDVLYGHESNGQSIKTLELFNEQQEIYQKLDKHPTAPDAPARARRSARDAISRGWDYVGAEFSWHFAPPEKPPVGAKPEHSRFAKIKVRHFFDFSYPQRDREEYNDWEGDGKRHRREHYDGLMLQYTGVLTWAKALPWFTGRYTLTCTTGLAQPFQHSTFELDLGATIGKFPLSFWYRHGYNSDLIDYYKENQSYGAKISIWKF